MQGVSVGQNYAIKLQGVSQLPTAYASSVPGAPSAPIIVNVSHALQQENGFYILQTDGTHFLLNI